MEHFNVLILSLIRCGVQEAIFLALKIEDAHIVTLVDNRTGIVMANIFQIFIFSDHPNTNKIVGSCLVVFSILMIGGNKA